MADPTSPPQRAQETARLIYEMVANSDPWPNFDKAGALLEKRDAETRRAAMADCAAKLCPRCAEGVPLIWHMGGLMHEAPEGYRHLRGLVDPCPAAAIRAAASANSRKEGEDVV